MDFIISTHTQIAGGLVFWRQWGAGKPLLLCLHGYADTGARFEHLAEALAGHYTVVAPDLPWHGQTEWQKDSFDRWDVQDLVEALCRLGGQGKCTLLGHSYGARLLLASMPLLEDHAEAAWFVAPGGFDAGSKWGGEKLPEFARKWLINSVQNHSGAWLKILERFVSIGLLGASAFRFFQVSFETPSRRERLFSVWRNLHHFRLRRRPLYDVSIPLNFVAGSRDPLIPIHAIRRFAGCLPESKFILLAESGHWPDGELLAREMLA